MISGQQLTQESCAFCEQAKEVLERLVGEYELAIEAVDMATAEGQVLAERGGVMFPPGVFVDGDAFSYGRLSERKLRREFERRVAAAT